MAIVPQARSSGFDNVVAPAPKRAASPQYEWARLRLIGGKLPAFHHTPVNGFGPLGDHTLYMPSPESKRSLTFVDGRPIISVVTPHIDDELIRIRDLAIVSCRIDAPPILKLHANYTLVRYSAMALSKVYDLNDEDLTFIHSGTKWLEPVFRHAMGGDTSVEALARIHLRHLSDSPIQEQPENLEPSTIFDDLKEFEESETYADDEEYLG